MAENMLCSKVNVRFPLLLCSTIILCARLKISFLRVESCPTKLTRPLLNLTYGKKSMNIKS